MEIRRAELEDLPILLEFEQGIILAERPFDDYLDKDPISYYNIKDLILSEDAEVAVAIVDNKIVGSGYAKIKKSKQYHKNRFHSFLGFMFVDSNFRGQGVNSKIIEYLTLWSKNRGLKQIKLNVYAENINAIKAYEKVGFKKNVIEMSVTV